MLINSLQRLNSVIENEGKCVIEDHNSLKIYGDILCGSLNLVLRDIPDIYDTVVKDQDLRSLSLTDWVITTLYTSQELPPLIEPSSSGQSPNRNVKHVVNEVVKKLYTDINSKQSGLSSTLEKLTESIANIMEASYENRSIDIRSLSHKI